MSFPLSPSNNQIALVNGIEYYYHATKGAWYRYGDGSANVITSNTFQVLSSIIFSDGTSQTSAPTNIDSFARSTANTNSNNITKVNNDNSISNSHNMINSNNVNNTADTIVNNTVDTIVNNNIQLVKFGEEDLKKIALETIKYLNGYEGFYNLIKDVHFNEEVPENHNIYVSNSKFKNACVYDGERWLLRNLDEVRGELIEKKYDFLCDRFDTLKGESKISSSMEKKFMRFCKNYSELTGKQEKDFKNSIDLILYNNRDLPKKGRKKLKIK